MAEAALPPEERAAEPSGPRMPQGPAALAPFARVWQRMSRRLVPVFAVITALIITIPLMILTRTDGDVIAGLQLAGRAYSALFEGAAGLAFNDLVDADNVDTVLQLAETATVEQRELLNLSRQTQELLAVGQQDVVFYASVIARYLGTEAVPDEDAFDALGSRMEDIRDLGAEELAAIGPLVVIMGDAPRADLNQLAAELGGLRQLSPEQRAAIIDLMPDAAAFDDGVLLLALRRADQLGVVRLERVYEQFLVLTELGLTPDDSDAEAIGEIYELAGSRRTSVQRVLDLADANARFAAAGIDDISELESEFRLVNSLYSERVLTNPNVGVALREELPVAIESGLLVRRANNRILYAPGKTETSGIIYRERIVSAEETRTVARAAYLRLGGSVLLFFPGNLEETLTRAIPYIIAGLAVALGFKAGLFNIGAEGQLYAGAVLATWVGFASPFAGLPWVLHIPLVIMMGLIGGAMWGMIPGLLKAYTGAHEVINTIMLNFIAIRLVDWLIKSTDPIILLDTTASTPRTPFIAMSARLPTFDNLQTWVFIAAGVLTLAVSLWARRERIQQDTRAVIRPLIYAAIVVIGGIFLSWMTVRGILHVGLVIMIFAVWFVDWFLERTTPGFELRTVGANPNAARYAGMNVKLNIVLAMTISGSLAGLAGTVQITGLQHNIWPEFFAGLGFDSIAVALLARNNPRNIIPAGILWGGLLSGAGLMQATADISIDLVRIVQALIIMFIAADAIIRTLWRVPEATPEEKASAQFSTGWGG